MKVNRKNGKQRALKSAFVAGALALSAGAALAAPKGPTHADEGWAQGPNVVGETVRDGTVLAGGGDSDAPLYTTPADAPGFYNWQKGKAYCDDLVAHGHDDWSMPTADQLNILFRNRAAIGGFKAGRIEAFYHSSTEHDVGSDGSWYQNFSDGNRGWYNKKNIASLRCVRS